MAEVRSPQVAGQFYPSEPQQLQQTIDQYLSKSMDAPALDGELIAVLAPHAGYPFSGAIQGYSYHLLKKNSFNTVIVIGTAHYFPVEGAAVYDGSAYQTPLGVVATDKDFIKDLLGATSWIESNSSAHDQEHSVETQIPFLQRTLSEGFQVVPIVMGGASLEVCQTIGRAIAQVAKIHQDRGKKTLLVASSDLTHYPTDEDARRVDSSTLEALLTLDASYFAKVNAHWMKSGIHRLVCTYCGEGALTTVMIAAKAMGADHAHLWKYATSADVPSGKKEKVVGYAAVAFIQSSQEKQEPTFSAPKETQKKLLQMARATIEKGILEKRPEKFDYPPGDPLLDQPSAVFVTLKEKGELRGCIGATEPRFPLGKAVQYFAFASAFQDPRFPPLSQEETAKVDIEISILSPLKRIQSAQEIIPTFHGVVVKQGGRSGIFLPQVWGETGWPKEVFLDQLCSQKAGLSARAWQDPKTELSIFTVFSFSEAETR